jgi:hypothetical protein
LERRAPPLRVSATSADPMTNWLCERYPNLMQRWAELIESVGADKALQAMTDDELEQFAAALRAAQQAMEADKPMN